MKIESDSLAVASKVVKTFAMNALRIRGDKLGANNRYLQLHDAKALPANATVPLRTYPIYATAPFDFNSEEVPVHFQNGMVVAVSTTENTLTIDTDTINLFVTGNSAYNDANWVAVGDYTTGVSSKDGWDAIAGPFALQRVEFTALTAAGATLYAKGFGVEAVALNVGAIPLFTIPLSNNTSADKMFNTVPNQTFDNVYVDGFCIVIDSTPGPLEGSYVGSNFAIKITYK